MDCIVHWVAKSGTGLNDFHYRRGRVGGIPSQLDQLIINFLILLHIIIYNCQLDFLINLRFLLFLTLF